MLVNEAVWQQSIEVKMDKESGDCKTSGFAGVAGVSPAFSNNLRTGCSRSQEFCNYLDNKIGYARSTNRLLIVLVIALAVVGLYAARALITPFIVALVILFILTHFENLISTGIKKLLSLFIKKEFSKRTIYTISTVSFVLALTISFFMLFFSYKAISKNLEDMFSDATRYQILFGYRITQFNNFMIDSHNPDGDGKSISTVRQIISMIPESHLPVIGNNIIEGIDFNHLFNTVGGFAGKSIANSTLVAIYLLFLYGERRSFHRKIEKIRQLNPKFEQLDKVIKNIRDDLIGYFNIKTIVSFITATLCYLVMFGFGLEFVWLWAFIIFILNYIPTIGSIVATILPSALGLIMFDNFVDAIFMMFSIATIQFVIGSVIEPKFQGDRLNLAPIMILLSLAIWGAIWGIVGMFVAVPIMVTINTTLSQFETTKPIAMFFSSNGDIKN